MPRWRAQDPESGMSISVESEMEPTDEELDAEFDRQRKMFMQGSKAAMGTDSEAIKGNLAAAGVGTALGLGGRALVAPGGIGAIAKGGAGYLGGEALEALGAPKWLGEVAGLASGAGGILKSGAKRIFGRAIEKQVADELKRQGVKRGMGEVEKRAAIEAARAARAAKAEEAVAAARASTAQPVTAAALAPEEQQLLLQAQQLMKTTQGRATIKQWLKTQPAEMQAQIKALLERGIAQPATTASGGFRSAPSGPSIPAGYGSELAKLLGQ